MSKENKTTGKTLVPEIRFEGFSGEWKRRKLSEIAQLTMGQSPSGKNYTLNPNDHVLVQGNADMQDGEVSPRVWTTEVTKEAIPNDIIMSVRAPVGDVGTTSYPVVLGRGVAGIRANDFIFSFLEGLKANNYWDKFSTGSTFQSINSNHLNSLILATPTESEQEKIGSFMRAVGNKVKTKQKELTKLQNFKQAMLQKLFPKEGEKEPEMRFDGFEDEWEESVLGKKGTTVSGTGFNEKEQNGKNGTPFFKVSDMETKDNHRIMLSANHLVNKKQIEANSWSVIDEVPAIVFAKVGGALLKNRKRLVVTPFLIDNNLMAYILDNNWDKNFALALFETINLPKYAQTGALPSFNDSIIKKIKVALPSLVEQKLIGDYFYNLDKNIQSKQAELKKLKQFKQAMLSKLFV